MKCVRRMVVGLFVLAAADLAFAKSAEEYALEKIQQYQSEISNRHVMLAALDQVSKSKSFNRQFDKETLRQAEYQLQAEQQMFAARRNQLSNKLSEALINSGAALREDADAVNASPAAQAIKEEFESEVSQMQVWLAPKPRPQQLQNVMLTAVSRSLEKLEKSKGSGRLAGLFKSKKSRDQARVDRAMQVNALKEALANLNDSVSQEAEAQRQQELSAELNSLFSEFEPNQTVELDIALADINYPGDSTQRSQYQTFAGLETPYVILPQVSAAQVSATNNGDYGSIRFDQAEVMQLVESGQMVLSDAEIEALVLDGQSRGNTNNGQSSQLGSMLVALDSNAQVTSENTNSQYERFTPVLDTHYQSVEQVGLEPTNNDANSVSVAQPRKREPNSSSSVAANQNAKVVVLSDSQLESLETAFATQDGSYSSQYESIPRRRDAPVVSNYGLLHSDAALSNSTQSNSTQSNSIQSNYDDISDGVALSQEQRDALAATQKPAISTDSRTQYQPLPVLPALDDNESDQGVYADLPLSQAQLQDLATQQQSALSQDGQYQQIPLAPEDQQDHEAEDGQDGAQGFGFGRDRGTDSDSDSDRRRKKK